MPMPSLSLRSFRLRMPFRKGRPAISIQMRIGLLCVVPVIAFAVIAGTSWSDQRKLDTASTLFAEQATTARLALLLSADVTTMQYEARRLAQTHAKDAAKTYTDTGAKFASDFGLLKTAAASDKFASARFAPVDSAMRRINITFSKLVTAVDSIGHGPDEGLTRDVEKTARAVEDLIAGAPGGAHRGAVERAFESIGQGELQFRVTGQDQGYAATAKELDELAASSDLILLPGDSRDALLTALQTYGKKLGNWAQDLSDTRLQSLAIEDQFKALLASIEGFRSSSEQAQVAAASALQVTRGQMLTTILVVIAIAAILTALLSFFVGRSITAPLRRLSVTMQTLASGRTDVDVPQASLRDEVGAMARTVLVFRDNAAERERLAAAEASETE